MGFKQLIIINVVVFSPHNILVRLMVDYETYANFLTYVAMPTDLDLLITRPWTFITSFFTHEGLMHILFNMLYLYWFGMVLKEYLGSDRFISLFILGGLMGSVAIILLFNFIPSFYEMSGGIALGASAGVFAITVGAATLAPNYSFNLLLFGPVKIKYIAIILVVLSVLGLKGNNIGGEVAHLSGSLIGYFYIKNLQKGRDIGAWVTRFLLFVKSFFVRQPKMKVNYSRPKKELNSKYKNFKI